MFKIEKQHKDKTCNSKLLALVTNLLDQDLEKISQDNTEDLIIQSTNNLYEIFNLSKSAFAIIGIDQLLLQYTKSKDEKEINITKVQDWVHKNETKLSNKEIISLGNDYLLPLFIQKKLIAIFYLEDLKTKNKNLIHDLSSFAEIFSSLISQNQVIKDLLTNNANLLNQENLKSELICTISHELRTPMANILGFSEILTNKELGAKTDTQTKEKYLNEIYKSAKRLNTLIDNFLDLSKIENNGALNLNHFEEAEIDWLAQEAWRQLNHINQENQISWQFENINEINNFYCDIDGILRVFINLFSNAIKYGAKGSKIVCRINNDKNYILVEIINQGIGIKEEDLSKIFDKFYRSKNNDNELINGTGLGLWICKEIIEAHSGKIWCESSIGKETKFSFRLSKGNWE